MTRRLALLALFLIVACRTGRPSGAPVAPLTAPTSDAMRQLLREQRAQFHGMKSLMRVRATRAGQTQSFRAQLVRA